MIIVPTTTAAAPKSPMLISKSPGPVGGRVGRGVVVGGTGVFMIGVGVLLGPGPGVLVGPGVAVGPGVDVGPGVGVGVLVRAGVGVTLGLGAGVLVGSEQVTPVAQYPAAKTGWAGLGSSAEYPKRHDVPSTV